MENFKTYYQINEGIGSAIAAAAGAVAGGIGSTIRKGEEIVGGLAGKVVPGKAKGMAEGDFLMPDIDSVTTFEDLNKLVTGVINKGKFGEVKDQAVGFAVDQVLGLIPGAGNIKSAYDFFKGVSKQPDESDTGSFIDLLDVDDDLAKIIDDPIEGRFLKFIQKKIANKTGKIPPDWDINMDLKQYLSDEFEGRTVAGSEEAKGPAVKADPHLKNIKA